MFGDIRKGGDDHSTLTLKICYGRLWVMGYKRVMGF